MNSKTTTIIIIAVVAIIVIGCVCFFLFKDKGGDDPVTPVYEGEWATKTIYESYYEDGMPVYREIPVGEDRNLTITKLHGFYKLDRGGDTYFAVQKYKGLLSVSSGDNSTIATAIMDGDHLILNVLDLNTQHVLSMDFARVLKNGKEVTWDDLERSWNPTQGQTYQAYQKTRYVGDVPIDYNDRSYVLTVDMVTPKTIMYHQTFTQLESDKAPVTINSTAVQFSKDGWLAIGMVEDMLLIDYLTVQDGNLYLFSASEYEGAFSIWDVRYGDKSKNKDLYTDEEGDIGYAVEKTLFVNESGRTDIETRNVMLYGNRSFDDHQLMNLICHEEDVCDNYAFSLYGVGGSYICVAQSVVTYNDKQYDALIFGEKNENGLTVSGICYGAEDAVLFIQEYQDPSASQYPVVSDISVTGDEYRFFKVQNADNPNEYSPLAWGARTYKNTQLVSDSITWDPKVIVVDHTTKSVELRGNDKADQYKVTLTFDKVDDLDATVTDGKLAVSLDGIKTGFTVTLQFETVDRLIGDWELVETIRGAWDGIQPYHIYEYEKEDLMISKFDDVYRIVKGDVDVLGVSDGRKIATAGLSDDIYAAYILPIPRSECIRMVYFEGKEAVVDIYAPKGYAGPFYDSVFTCDLPEIGEQLKAFKIRECKVDPVDHIDYDNTFTLSEVEDGMIFYTVDTLDADTIYCVGLYLNGSEFFSYCNNYEFEYVEMVSFYDDVIYTQSTTSHESTWIGEYGDEAKAVYPYKFFEKKIYEGTEDNIIYRDGKVVEENDDVPITLRAILQNDEFVLVMTLSDNDEQASTWAIKVGKLGALGNYPIMASAFVTYKGVNYEGTYVGQFSENLGHLDIIGNLLGDDGSSVIIKQSYDLER
jgi:hypothetical protein